MKNVTISMDEPLLRRVKLEAGRAGVSVSRWIADELQRLIGEDAEKAAARARIEAFLDAGPKFALSENGKITIDRDELYDGGRFIDTTTLLYSQDVRDPLKQARATAWLRSLIRFDAMVLSLQVLNETYAVVKRKPEFAHWRAGVRPFLLDLARWATAYPAADQALADAWAIEDRYRIGIWDSLLLASAHRDGCDYFLSEDLSDGQSYGAVIVLNPFRHAPEDVLAAPAP